MELPEVDLGTLYSGKYYKDLHPYACCYRFKDGGLI